MSKTQSRKDLETILIADDDPGIILLIKSILASQKFRLLTAENGNEAKSLLEKEADNVVTVLLDWSMPGMNGIDLLRWIKDQPTLEHVPVIMQTALDAPEHTKEGIEAGAYYYVTKPFSKEVLLSIVSAAVTDFRDRRALTRMLLECQNPFRFIEDGTFHFRTLEDAQFLSLMIANACPVPSNALSVSELFINAVEHGNLGITYEDKTAYMEQGTWHEEVDRRLALPQNHDKYVIVRVKRHPDKLTISVEDQGPGFEYEKYLTMDESRVFHVHGRGIAMTTSVLELEYIGSGNRVVVTVPLQS
ncbi:MAG: response regulator [Bacteroidetes bacterium]|nr:response regulator [Bacteroidota bacterium]